MKKSILIVLSLICLTGCAAKTNYVSDMCLIAKPITISKKDILTNLTLKQIYLHNVLLEHKCKKESNGD